MGERSVDEKSPAYYEVGDSTGSLYLNTHLVVPWDDYLLRVQVNLHLRPDYGSFGRMLLPTPTGVHKTPRIFKRRGHVLLVETVRRDDVWLAKMVGGWWDSERL